MPTTTETSQPTTATSAAHGPVRAIVQSRHGGPDTWALGEVPRPTIAADEVLVDVRAAAIDHGTWHLMTGTPYLSRLAFGLRRPKQPVPGLDVAGVVVEVGAGVTRLAPGDEVFGIARGSLTTVAAARADKLALKPAALSFAQAAALGVSGLTALQGLVDVGRLTAGQHVLVTGASGGVGTFAVQIAVAHGAAVTAVASPAKRDLVTGLGAHTVIDRGDDLVAAALRAGTEGARPDVLGAPAVGRSPRSSSEGAGFDLIFDPVGTVPLRHLRRLLTPRGTLVVVGNAEGGRWLGGLDRQLRAMAWSPFVTQRLTAQVSKECHQDLERLAVLAADGRLVPSVERTWPLEQAADAMRHLDAGLARGKLVVVTSSGAEPATGTAVTS